MCSSNCADVPDSGRAAPDDIQVLNYGDKPLLVASYSRAAAKAFEPFGKLKGEVVYEQSLAQVTLLDAGVGLAHAISPLSLKTGFVDNIRGARRLWILEMTSSLVFSEPARRQSCLAVTMIPRKHRACPCRYWMGTYSRVGRKWRIDELDLGLGRCWRFN